MTCPARRSVASRLPPASWSSSVPVESIPGPAAPFSASTTPRRLPARKARSGPTPEQSLDDARQPALQLFRSQMLRSQALLRKCSPELCSALEPKLFLFQQSRIRQPWGRRMRWRRMQRRQVQKQIARQIQPPLQFSQVEFQSEELLELEPQPGLVPLPPLAPLPRTGLRLQVSERQESARQAIRGGLRHYR